MKKKNKKVKENLKKITKNIDINYISYHGYYLSKIINKKIQNLNLIKFKI